MFIMVLVEKNSHVSNSTKSHFHRTTKGQLGDDKGSFHTTPLGQLTWLQKLRDAFYEEQLDFQPWDYASANVAALDHSTISIYQGAVATSQD
jgi:hypothetical protein